MILANIIAIFRKELQGYFASPFAYVIAAVFWLISLASYYNSGMIVFLFMLFFEVGDGTHAAIPL